jgi:hypothetical protein
MAKWVSANVLDGALSVLAGATRMVAVAGQPADFMSAQAGALASVAMTGGDFALGAGVGQGRKVSIGGKPAVAVSAAGTADHVALLDDGGSRLLYVTTCPAQVLTAGGTVNFGSWSVEIGAPV